MVKCTAPVTQHPVQLRYGLCNVFLSLVCVMMSSILIVRVAVLRFVPFLFIRDHYMIIYISDVLTYNKHSNARGNCFNSISVVAFAILYRTKGLTVAYSWNN